MEIEKLKVEKDKLEKHLTIVIGEAVRQFQKDTGVRLESINVELFAYGISYHEGRVTYDYEVSGVTCKLSI